MKWIRVKMGIKHIEFQLNYTIFSSILISVAWNMQKQFIAMDFNIHTLCNKFHVFFFFFFEGEQMYRFSINVSFDFVYSFLLRCARIQAQAHIWIEHVWFENFHFLFIVLLCTRWWLNGPLQINFIFHSTLTEIKSLLRLKINLVYSFRLTLFSLFLLHLKDNWHI